MDTAVAVLFCNLGIRRERVYKNPPSQAEAGRSWTLHRQTRRNNTNCPKPIHATHADPITAAQFVHVVRFERSSATSLAPCPARSFTRCNPASTLFKS